MTEPKITICPPGPKPQRFTASCAEMGKMLMGSPDGDLTIDQRRDVWKNRMFGAVPIEDRIAALIAKSHGEKK